MDFTALTNFLESLEPKYGVPGFEIRITLDHKTIYRKTGGHSDYNGTVPVSGNELYYIYSASKVIAMTAAMQLIVRGQLGLDDPVSMYLPEFEHMQVADHFDFSGYPAYIPSINDPHHPAHTPITIRMLMSMTAGLNYDTGSETILSLKKQTSNMATTRQMMGAIAGMPLLFEPGTRYSYSLGHDVIAGVIEVVSGLSYSEYLRKYIFDPLEITDMYFHLSDPLRKRLMAQYISVPESNTIRAVPQENSYCLSDCYESGGAGICCTAEAYSKVLEALANGGTGGTGRQILTPEGIAMLAENQLNKRQLLDYQMPWRMEYGYGLGVRTLIDAQSSPSPYGEFGWDGAAGAYALVDPVNHISIFYAQEILSMLRVYQEIHPQLRDLTYAALFN